MHGEAATARADGQESALTGRVLERGSKLLVSASGHVPPEKLRLLRAILAHACQNLRDGLFDICEVMFETHLRDIAVRPVEALEMQGADWLVTLCSVRHHNTLSCIGLDAAAANLCIEAFMGGGARGRSLPPPRAWTALDHVLVGQAAGIVAAALQEAFAPSMELAMTTSEIRPGDATEELALEERPVLAAEITLQALEEEGRLVIVLPPSLVTGLRACAVAPEGGAAEPQEAESPWQRELDSQLRSAEVACRAVMDGGEITLREVAGLRRGQVLPLQVTEGMPVRLECDGETLFHCALGQADGMFVLKLLRAAEGSGEFMESMAASGEQGDE